jgi:hypothetical protein
MGVKWGVMTYVWRRWSDVNGSVVKAVMSGLSYVILVGIVNIMICGCDLQLRSHQSDVGTRCEALGHRRHENAKILTRVHGHHSLVNCCCSVAGLAIVSGPFSQRLQS